MWLAGIMKTLNRSDISLHIVKMPGYLEKKAICALAHSGLSVRLDFNLVHL